jgi:hypothetical protein
MNNKDKITIIPSGTPEWEEARLSRFTASCASFLITNPRTKKERESGQLSKTLKSYIVKQVAEEDTGFATHFSTPSTEWGIQQEEEAADYIGQVYGTQLKEAGFIPYGDHAGATPDRFILENGQVQIKCPDAPENHYKYLLIRNQNQLKTVYPLVYWQMQFELLCSPKTWALFASYCKHANERLKLKTLVVLPLKEDQILLKDRLEKAIEYKELLRFEYSLNKPAGLPEEIKRLEAPDRSRLGSVWDEL